MSDVTENVEAALPVGATGAVAPAESQVSAAGLPTAIERAYATPAAVRVISGPVGTGKTHELVEGVRTALEAGVEPAEVLVLAPRRTAADELAARLTAACGAVAAAVRVTTPLQLALDVLATPQAREATGRSAHVLSDVENTFFLEDMRVTGQKHRRLRELLKFLQRGWSEMRDDEPGWLITGEEVAINDFAKGRLALLEALHPAEVSAACVRYLLGNASALAAARMSCVFVDDARAMSRASQALAALLATDELVLTWDPNASLAGEEPYGYAEGLADLHAARSDASVLELGESHCARALFEVTSNVLRQECLETPVAPKACACDETGELRVVESPTLGDEPASVVEQVRGLLEAGVSPEDVFVAAPSDAWVRRMAGTLEAAGVATSALYERQRVGGDIRELDRSEGAQLYVALQLAADPAGALAWRCWCGFGDYLACSAGMNELYARAEANGRGLVAELEALACGIERGAGATPVVGAERIAERYRAGRAFLDAVDGLRGEQLLGALAAGVAGPDAAPEAIASVEAPVRALLGGVAADEDASTLFARAERELRAPGFAPACVRVARTAALAGQSPAALVFAGMVNGLIPSHAYFDLTEAHADEQARLHRRLVDELYLVSGKPTRALVCSTFAHAGIVESEKLRLKTERVRLRDGKRVCDLAPSVCVSYLRGESLAKLTL
ncbi:MAG: AAA family ATPase [Coriobacteriia bacterium]|nr:AAA family ATPase [Coriobacteriia bacterium]MBS5477588.1 AAA family ATPase [Coriobacteriia bacterium]